MRAGLRSAALALAFAFAPAASVPASPEQDYATAMAHYEAGRYAEAEAAFRALVREHGEHPVALLGLGNAAYRTGSWVEAVHAYEWGLRLDPGNDALEANLAQARAHLIADVFATEESAGARQARLVLARVPGRLTLLAGLALWTLGWLVAAARLRGRMEGWTWLAVALILLATPAFAHAGWQRHRVTARVEGVLVPAKVDIRSGPGSAYQVLFTLHAGAVVTALEERTGWRRVRLPNGAEGWMPDASLALIGDAGAFER